MCSVTRNIDPDAIVKGAGGSMQIRRFLLVAGLVCLTCGTADAQSAGKTAVTMGYPASIGIIWDTSH